MTQGGGGKNGDFWMTSFVNDPLVRLQLASVFALFFIVTLF